MKLVWGKSGDFIKCIPIDIGFVEYWIDSQQNFIWQTTSCFPQRDLIDELNTLIIDVDKELSRIKIRLIDSPITIDQSTINILHTNWVLLFKKHPNINKLFGISFKNKMDRINKALHELEESWKLQIFTDGEPIVTDYQIPTIFGKSNIEIPYENLGRSSYNKWANFDNNITEDTNDFNELHYKVQIHLNRTYTTQPPIEYVNWCKELSIIPRPNHLLLANFSNLETKQDTYRALFMKNFVLDNNDVIFTL
jgi:hypothetical protein